MKCTQKTRNRLSGCAFYSDLKATARGIRFDVPIVFIQFRCGTCAPLGGPDHSGWSARCHSGASGNGKSTIVNLAMELIARDKDKIWIEDLPLARSNWRSQLGDGRWTSGRVRRLERL
jgi:hypothetical protein